MDRYHRVQWLPNFKTISIFFVNIYYDDKISAWLVENRQELKILSASFSFGTSLLPLVGVGIHSYVHSMTE